MVWAALGQLSQRYPPPGLGAPLACSPPRQNEKQKSPWLRGGQQQPNVGHRQPPGEGASCWAQGLRALPRLPLQPGLCGAGYGLGAAHVLPQGREQQQHPEELGVGFHMGACAGDVRVLGTLPCCRCKARSPPRRGFSPSWPQVWVPSPARSAAGTGSTGTRRCQPRHGPCAPHP